MTQTKTQQMIQITLNGQPKNVAEPMSVTQLLDAEDMAGMMVAVARNGSVVPRSSWDDVAIESGDAIEIVAPMQGG